GSQAANKISNLENVIGGAGNDILVGNAVANGLTGGPGRDLLIGGAGADRLYGGGEDDLLIGGTTSWDSNNAALQAILAEWNRTDLVAAERIKHLRNGGGLNVLNGSPIRLSASTVFDDLAADALTGSLGNDWFWTFPGD